MILDLKNKISGHQRIKYRNKALVKIIRPVGPADLIVRPIYINHSSVAITIDTNLPQNCKLFVEICENQKENRILNILSIKNTGVLYLTGIEEIKIKFRLKSDLIKNLIGLSYTINSVKIEQEPSEEIYPIIDKSTKIGIIKNQSVKNLKNFPLWSCLFALKIDRSDILQIFSEKIILWSLSKPEEKDQYLKQINFLLKDIEKTHLLCEKKDKKLPIEPKIKINLDEFSLNEKTLNELAKDFIKQKEEIKDTVDKINDQRQKIRSLEASQSDQSCIDPLIQKIEQLNILFQFEKELRKQSYCISSILWKLASSELYTLLQIYQDRLDHEILKLEGIIEVINKDLSTTMNLFVEQEDLSNHLKSSKEDYDKFLELYHQKTSLLQSTKDKYQKALIQQMLMIYKIINKIFSS